MIDLIQCEIKKLSSATFFIIILVILLIVNVVLCADYTKERSASVKKPLLEAAFEEYQKDPQAFLHDYQHLIQYYEESASLSNLPPQDPYRFGGSAWGITDWELYEEVLEEVEAEAHYKDKISGIISQANGIRKGLPNKDSFNYRYQNNIIKIYSSLKEQVRFKNNLIFSWDLLFSYESDYFPVVLIVILCTAYIALCDKQNGFYAISSVCKKGRHTSAIAKLLSSLVLTVALVLFFSISSVITIGIVNGGYSTSLEAVQAMQKGYGFADMTYFPFALNMWQGYLMAIFFKVCAAMILTICVFFISMLVQKIWISFLFGGGLVTFCYFISQQEGVNSFAQWKHLNLQSLFSPNQMMSRYRAVNIFENVIDLNAVLYLILVVFLLLVLLLSFWLYPRRKKTFLKAFSRPLSYLLTIKKTWRPSLSLSHYERVKNQVFPIFFVLLVILKFATASMYYQPDTTSYDRVYKDYIDSTIGGVYTEEKKERILYEMDWFREVISRYEEMNEKYHTGKVSSDEFMRYLREYSSADQKLNVLTDLYNQAKYLENLYMQKGILGSFAYDTGYSRFIYQGVDWILLLFVCIFAARQYLVEFEKGDSGSNVFTLTQTTKRGRIPLFIQKSLNCALVVLPIWTVCKGIDLYYLLKNYELPNLSIPVASFSIYADTPNRVSLMDYWVGITFLSLLGTLLLSQLIFLLTFLVRKRFLVYALTALTVLIPHFAAKTGVALGNYIDLTMLYDTDRLFRQYKLFGSCLFFALLIFITALGFILAKKKVKERNI